MTGHLDTETLAAFGEEMLPRRRAKRVSAHLAACPECARTVSQLAEVTALLASSSAPALPPAAAERIAAAIAAEAVTAGNHSGEKAGRAERTTGRRYRQPLWPALRAAAAAAAAIMVAGGGIYGLAHLGSSSSAGLSSTAGAPASNPRIHLGTAHPANGVASGATRASPEFSTSYPVVSSGTDYQPGQLSAQVRSLVTQDGGAPAALRWSTARPVGPFSDFHDLMACVARVTGRQAPRFVDVARYRGRVAVAIVMAAHGALTPVRIVGAGCSVLARASVTQVAAAPTG